MTRRPAAQFLLALVLKRVLGRLTRRPEPAPAVAPVAPASPPPARRGALLAFTLASLAVGMVLMLVFHAGVTRVVGVLALFAFIVSGVFLIAHPAFLGQEESTPRRGG
jgi:hypothetical protein